jgi:hypothetical protein
MNVSADLRAVVRLACRAPSVHNTQPWAWRLRNDTLELGADRTRQLPVEDPHGRNLLISCGAALHHAEVAARGLGFEPAVTRFPDRAQPDLLARITFTPTRVTPDTEADLAALERRCTDRRRFTSWPVPEDRLQHLCDVLEDRAAQAVVLDEQSTRFLVERLIRRAMAVEADDPRYAAEQQWWVGHSATDGVPVTHVPESTNASRARPSRFGGAPRQEPLDQSVEGTDGVLAIVTRGDDVPDWLGAGEALSALWLRATRDGISVVPLSQAIEVEETRATLHRDVFSGGLVPQLLMRVGWQGVTREPLAHTPRRPLDAVLDG